MKKILFLIVILTSSVYAQNIENKLSLTPSIGAGMMIPNVWGESQISNSSYVTCAAIKGQYQVINNLWVGLRLGGLTGYNSNTGFGATPLYAATIEYTFTKDFSLGLELLVLPTVTATFGNHQISLSVFPFYLMSGGSTTFSLMYGHRFLL